MMLKQIALSLCLISTFAYTAQAYSENRQWQGPPRPVFVREAKTSKAKEEPVKPEEDYKDLLQQAIDLHNKAFKFSLLMSPLQTYKNAKISVGIAARRRKDFETCNRNLLGRYFSDPVQVWDRLKKEMETRCAHESAQLLQDALNDRLGSDDIDALSGIEATELANMSEEEKQKYADNEYLAKLGAFTEDPKTAISKNTATWKIGREILLDLYEHPNHWGKQHTNFPLWTDAQFLLSQRHELEKEGRWEPEWSFWLSKPLPFPQEVALVAPQGAGSFEVIPELPAPWKVYKALHYNPYLAAKGGEMNEWFSVSGTTVSLKGGKDSVLGANRLSQLVALDTDKEYTGYVLRAADKGMNFLWNSIDEAKTDDLPFPTSLNTKGVSSWNKEEWKKVTDEDDWNSVRSAILSKKESVMGKLKATLDEQQVNYTPVNADNPTDIQYWYYALMQDKNADVVLTPTTIKDIDARIREAQTNARLQQIINGLSADEQEEYKAFLKTQKNVDGASQKQTEERWAEQTKPLDEDTCLGDGILDAQNFNTKDILKLSTDDLLKL